MTDLKLSQQMMSSCSGAIITSIFMTPFDVVKVRLQAQQRAVLERRCFLYSNGLMDHICECVRTCTHPENGPWYDRPVPPHLNGTLDAFAKITRREGIQSLWSGLPPTLVVALPSTVIYLTTYEHLRSFLGRTMPDSNNGVGNTPPPWTGGLAGGLARIWAVTVVSPFELVRTKMQAKSISYKELCMALQGQIATEGVISLWKGWVPTILRDVPFSVLYWSSYEQLKKVMNQEVPTFSFALAAGALSGGVAGTLTLPLDVIKTHRQIEIDNARNGGSTARMLMRIYSRQGIKGLFAGLVPRLAKVMPACAIMIATYEHAKKFFRNKQEKART